MRIRRILVPAIALAAAWVIWRFNPVTTPPALAGTWRVGLGADTAQGRQYDELPADTPFRFSLHSTRPQHVYLFSFSAEDGTLLLFPAPGLRTDGKNPLPAGNTVLPGKDGSTDLAWTTRSGIRALTSVIAIAADEPIAELDALLPRLRHWSNTVFQDGAMNVTAPTDSTQWIGKPGEPPPSPMLQQIAGIQVLDDDPPNGEMKGLPGHFGVGYCKWMVKEQRKQ